VTETPSPGSSGARRRCIRCGGPLRSNSKTDICWRNPECRKEASKRASSRYYLFERETIREKCREKYERDKDKIRRRMAEVKRTEEGRARYLVTLAKSHAKRIGVPFELTWHDLVPLPEYCPVLGIKLTMLGTQDSKWNSFSIDRLDSSGGYTPDNVRIISCEANRLKSDGTAEQHAHIAQWMVEEQQKNKTSKEWEQLTLW
jgi:hypothetical protein